MENKNTSSALNTAFDNLERFIDVIDSKTDNMTSKLTSLAVDYRNTAVEFNTAAGNLNSVINDVKSIANIYKETKMLDAHIEFLKNQFAVILSKHHQTMSIIDHVFAERRLVLNKLSMQIDKASQKNDTHLELELLKLQTTIILANPLEKIANHVNNNVIDFDSDEPLNLDF